MKKPYCVHISKQGIHVFPKNCVVCGEKTEKKLPVTGNPKVSPFGGWQWLAGKSVKVNVYGHKRCIEDLNHSLSIRTLLLFLSISLFLPMYIFEWNPYVFFPIILVIICAVLYYMIKRPVPFEVTEISDSLLFEFTNKTVASEFAKINNASLF